LDDILWRIVKEVIALICKSFFIFAYDYHHWGFEICHFVNLVKGLKLWRHGDYSTKNWDARHYKNLGFGMLDYYISKLFGCIFYFNWHCFVTLDCKNYRRGTYLSACYKPKHIPSKLRDTGSVCYALLSKLVNEVVVNLTTTRSDE